MSKIINRVRERQKAARVNSLRRESLALIRESCRTIDEAITARDMSPAPKRPWWRFWA